ncbi:carboxypeptidase-like regulatory domain-containing protein [Longimonas halophila]|nr:carboxypeptidase-like regulatory domain-containing protein [Longimonas halophila]
MFDSISSATPGIWSILFGVLVLTTGCDLTDNPLCPAVIEPAVVVEVRNAVSGGLEADGVTGTLTDGAVRDTMIVAEANGEGETISLQGALGRPGTYEVTITKDGFEPWVRSGIEVAEGECNVQTARLTAELQPTSDG